MSAEAEAIARLREKLESHDGDAYGPVNFDDLRALLDAHAALEASNATLRLLVAGLTIAVDMEPSEDPLEEPWVRLVEAAHKHGRKLEREALETAHTEALDALEKLQAAQKHVLEVMCAGEDAYMAAFDGAEAVLAKAGRR